MIAQPPTTDKDINEQALESAMFDYIEGSKRYKHGGIVNLICIIAQYCENEYEATEIEDWETARQVMDEAAQKCDLHYRKG